MFFEEQEKEKEEIKQACFCQKPFWALVFCLNPAWFVKNQILGRILK